MHPTLPASLEVNSCGSEVGELEGRGSNGQRQSFDRF